MTPYRTKGTVGEGGDPMAKTSNAQGVFARALAEKVLSDNEADRYELMRLVDEPLEPLAKAAVRIRDCCCGTEFDLCAIMSVKSGICTEDCAFCAQSSQGPASALRRSFQPAQRIAARAKDAFDAGSHRFAMVASGGRAFPAEVDVACDAARMIRESSHGKICASLGLLDREDFERLRKAGVTRIHNNLETSRAFFPRICTTHSYDEKLQAIRNAQAVGLEVCSGGIVGMGESWADRIDLAIELRSLGVTSVPVNVLNPIPGTRLEGSEPLSLAEVRRIFAIFRFVLPYASLRLAGGRSLFPDAGRACLSAGANAAISGDMLTTAGFALEDDKRMFEQEGFVAHW